MHILSVLPIHEKAALVSYMILTLDHIGPACIGENEADGTELGDKSSLQRLSTGGCARQAGLAQSSPGSHHAALATSVSERSGDRRRGKDSLRSEPSARFPFYARHLVCQCFPELFSLPSLTQMLSVTVHDCTLLVLTSAQLRPANIPLLLPRGGNTQGIC